MLSDERKKGIREHVEHDAQWLHLEDAPHLRTGDRILRRQACIDRLDLLTALEEMEADNAALIEHLTPLLASLDEIDMDGLQTQFECHNCKAHGERPDSIPHEPGCILLHPHPGTALLQRHAQERDALRKCAHGDHAGQQSAGGEFICTVCDKVLVSSADTLAPLSPLEAKLLEQCNVLLGLREELARTREDLKSLFDIILGRPAGNWDDHRHLCSIMDVAAPLQAKYVNGPAKLSDSP